VEGAAGVEVFVQSIGSLAGYYSERGENSINAETLIRDISL
jgi:hypothetical protein